MKTLPGAWKVAAMLGLAALAVGVAPRPAAAQLFGRRVVIVNPAPVATVYTPATVVAAPVQAVYAPPVVAATTVTTTSYAAPVATTYAAPVATTYVAPVIVQRVRPRKVVVPHQVYRYYP